jgi:hypothetical protein
MWSYGEKGMRSLTAQGHDFKANKVDLIFQPRPELAARTTDLTRVYDGEVVIKGVDVQRMDRTGMSVSSVITSVQSTADPATQDDKNADAQKPTKKDQKEAQPRSWISKLFSWP